MRFSAYIPTIFSVNNHCLPNKSYVQLENVYHTKSDHQTSLLMKDAVIFDRNIERLMVKYHDQCPNWYGLGFSVIINMRRDNLENACVKYSPGGFMLKSIHGYGCSEIQLRIPSRYIFIIRNDRSVRRSHYIVQYNLDVTKDGDCHSTNDELYILFSVLQRSEGTRIQSIRSYNSLDLNDNFTSSRLRIPSNDTMIDISKTSNTNCSYKVSNNMSKLIFIRYWVLFIAN